jgi:NADPH:quinone reductase-like Zn-dependent oxidoreductase
MEAISHEPPAGMPSLKFTTDVHAVPVPEVGEALIRVHFAGIIASELYWPIYQDQTTHQYCGAAIPCHDFSGTVEDCPGGEFKAGARVVAFTTSYDQSHGWRKYQGAAAQYALADVSSVLSIPETLGLEQAASFPLSALTCWQAFHEKIALRTGMNVLVNGAAGPTGIWAVQIAKLFGAHVTGTASDPAGIQKLKDLPLSPDEIVEYKSQDITTGGARFDVMLDTIGGSTAAQQAKAVVKAKGTIISICDPMIAETIGSTEVHVVFHVVRMVRADLETVLRYIQEGSVLPVIDSVWDLKKGVEAFQYASRGHSHGRVLLRCE